MTFGFPSRPARVAASLVSAAAILAVTACSSPFGTPTDPTESAAPAESSSAEAVPTDDRGAADDREDAVPAAELAPKLLAVGVTDYAHAEAAVDAGVRHLFFGTGADFNMLNGQGDPARSIAALEKRAGEPLTISVDEEGGLVQRLSGLIGELPSARQMAETMTPEQVRGMMAEHGRKMAELGITVDFAPDVDLAGGEEISDNAIGSRAFSADPKAVTDFARAYAQGLLDAGITPVIKHFPGHGHASGDSHEGAVTVPPRAELEKADLVPFQELSQMPGVKVMVGHLQSPDINPDAPGSVSPAVYQLLRDGWAGGKGYSGAVFTDDLTGMKAITDRYPGSESVVAALSAGADQALTAAGAIDVNEAIANITATIESGKIPREKAEEAVARLAS